MLTFPKLHCGLQLSQQISSNFLDALVALWCPSGRLALIGHVVHVVLVAVASVALVAPLAGETVTL